MAETTERTPAETYRPLLFSIAYGMTGSVGDAEDLVQDAFLGMTRAQRAGTVIAAPKAYLTTAVTRLGINHLGSARVRRETYVGDWLPEPLVAHTDGPGPAGSPAEHAELTDALSMALLVLLEALSPMERAVFVLREVFGHDYPDIARTVDKSEANCRQIFARARRRIPADATARLPRERRAEGAALARRFFTAADGGDLDALLGMLAPDVVFHGDGGGKARAISRTVRDAQQAAALLVTGFRSLRSMGATLRPAEINGAPGMVLYDTEGRVLSVVELHLVNGTVGAIHSLTNPDKLGHLGPVSDQGLLPRFR